MTLERQEYNEASPWWGEHLHRYYEANNLISKPKSIILDIACGSGFGSHYLSENGHNVIGCDIDVNTINECNARFENTNLNYIQADGAKLQFDNNNFDYVISFETIEHTSDYNKMLEEFKRVLKPEGKVIISTPNFNINSPKGIIVNKFHTQEWDYLSFSSLLNIHFCSFKIYGQEYTRYKNKKNLNFILAKYIEKILYNRGIRKLPIRLQNKFLKTLIGLPMYPSISDFHLTDIVDDIKCCKTFFAVCSP